MPPDTFAPLLQRFRVHAHAFFAGSFCGSTLYDGAKGRAYLHLLRGGRLRLRDTGGFAEELTEPTLILYSRPVSHWFDAGPGGCGADLVCASLGYAQEEANPITLALPPRLVVPLRELPTLQGLLQVLFTEAATDRPGRQQVLDRLFEIVLIELVRSRLLARNVDPGFLAGLAHPQVGSALFAMHAAPGRAWTLDALAGEASMSRTAFAATFKLLVGSSPGSYLTRWRMTVAQVELANGVPLKLVAERVGYDSQAGFLRAFKALIGLSPTAWLRANTPGSA